MEKGPGFPGPFKWRIVSRLCDVGCRFFTARHSVRFAPQERTTSPNKPWSCARRERLVLLQRAYSWLHCGPYGRLYSGSYGRLYSGPHGRLYCGSYGRLYSGPYGWLYSGPYGWLHGSTNGRLYGGADGRLYGRGLCWGCQDSFLGGCPLRDERFLLH